MNNIMDRVNIDKHVIGGPPYKARAGLIKDYNIGITAVNRIFSLRISNE